MFTVSESGGRRWLGAAVFVVGVVLLLLLGTLSPPAVAQNGPPTLTIAKETIPVGEKGFPFTLKSEGTSLIIGNLGGPIGITTDAEDNFYVAEWYNQRVQKFNAAGAFLMAWGWDVISGNAETGFEVCLPTDICKAGTSGSGNGQFNKPAGVAVDHAGYIYVVDAGNFRVQKFSATGDYLRQWGGYGTVGGQFNGPRDLVIDGAGAVYVTDYFNHRIQKFDADGNFLLSWGWDVILGNAVTGFEACTPANSCKAGTGGGGNGQFNNPYGIAVDPAGNIYVSDAGNNRIQKFDAAGAFLLAWGWDVIFGNAMTGFEACTPVDTCKRGVSGTGAGQYNYPFGLALDSAGNLYVGDVNNNRIQKTDDAGGFLGQWGSPGTGPGQFNYPAGIAVSPAGVVYVADHINNRIQKFVDAAFTLDDDTSVTYTLDPATFTISEVAVSDWELAEIFCDDGNPLVNGNQVTLTLAAGDNVSCTFTNNGPNQPPIAVNDAYTVDEDSALVVDPPGVLGNDTDTDGGPLTAILVDDVDHGDLTLNSDGSFTYTPVAGFSGPDRFTYVANDGTADSNVASVQITVNRISATLTIVKETNPPGGTGFPFTLVGQVRQWGSAGSGDGQFIDPHGAAVDSLGNVYIADPGNNRIQKFDSSGTYLLEQWPTCPGPIDMAIDSADHVFVLCSDSLYKSDSSGRLLSIRSLSPFHTGLGLDGDGNFYVANPYYGWVLKYNSNGQELANWGFTSPVDVAVDSTGFIYVAAGHNIHKLDSEGNPVSQWVSYPNPHDVVVDQAGNLYVANTNSIEKFSNTGTLLAGWSANSSGLAVDDMGHIFAPDSISDSVRVFVDYATTLDDGGSQLFDTLEPGNYDIREVPPEGWQMTSAMCTGGSPQPGTNMVKVTLTSNDDVTCTFTNYSPNEPPVAIGDAYTVDEDTTLVVDIPGVLGNDSDPDGDPLAAIRLAVPAHGSLLFNSDGSFVYSPELNYNGPDSFTYQVNDGMEDSNVATVAINVTPVNDPPVADDQAAATNEDTAVDITLTGGDIDSTALTFDVLSGPAHGALSGDPPALTYTPAADYNGNDSFTFVANDGTADSNEATVSISVNPVNDSPVVNWITPPASPAIAASTTVTAEATFSDVDLGDSHTCVWDWGDGTVEGPAPCSAGPVSGSHVYMALGSYTVTLTVTDSATDTDAVTAPVSVIWAFTGFFMPVDNPPVLNIVKAGSGVPVKFSLGGDQGLNIFALGYPKSVKITCDTGAPVDGIEETVTAGNSSLQYNLLEDRYTYVWKTDKAWTGTCRQFQIMLADGTMHTANFKFK